MIELTLKDGTKLGYDESQDKVYKNGKVTNDYKPAFVPNGDDEPTFFGFASESKRILYDVFGGESKLSKESDIKL